jgi:spermidine synthase
MSKPSKTSAPPAARPFPRGYLYFTAAMTGGAVMIVEILGAKMLSPFVGTSHFVWTAQIAVTLVALACGYYFGGGMADKSQSLARLYRCIAAAALYLLLTVLAVEPVAYFCLNFNLAIGTLLASAVLFFVPLALLAVTGPFLVRIITSSVAGVGGNVGRLTAVGTLGSFAGTLLIGYVMVPLLPNSVAMYLTSALLLMIVAGYFLLARRTAGGAVAALLAVPALAGAWGFAHPRSSSERVSEKFRGNSHFGELRVVDRRDGVRYYLNDLLVQNTYDPRTRQSASAFTYMLERMALASTTNISSVLCIGMGVGIVPMEFARRGARVEVVEINPAIIPVAANYFGFEPGKVTLHVGDGRQFLKRCTRQYDAVVLDAFLGDSSPSHLMTREAFAEINRVLAPGGVLTINSFGELEPGQDFFPASLHKTLRSVFKHVRLHSSGHGAVFFAAANHPLDQFLRSPDLDDIHPEAEAEVESAFRNVVDTDPEHGIVLTDNYNPVEFYDAHHREGIRRNLASAARNL